MIYLHKFLPGYRHSFELKYEAILKQNGIAYQIVDSHEDRFWDDLAGSRLFIMFLGQTQMHLQRQINLITTIDRYLKIPCFPNWDMVWHFDDKVAQQHLLEAMSFPVAKSHVFWNKELALEWADKTSYPKVFKLKGGAGSLNVVIVNSQRHANLLINKMFSKGIRSGRVPGVDLLSIFRGSYKTMFKSYLKELLYDIGARSSTIEDWSRHQGYAYFQDFLPGNTYDTRVTVIGDRAFGFLRHNRHNDFRSSGSGNIDFTPDRVDMRMIKAAFKISQALNFQTMAYDFLFDAKREPVVNEMCCQFADWAIYQCPGFWDADLNWHEGHYWPQYLQLQDLLKDDKLKQPSFDLSNKKSRIFRV